jgi:hypothetical protein
MASTFSPSLRLELVGDGDQSGIWGQTTNNNLGSLIEQAIGGVVTIGMVDANYTLTNFNGVVDEARNQVIIATGALSAQRNIIAPLVEKTYIIRNNTTGGFGVQIIAPSGTGVVIPNGVTASVYCDGTNFLPSTTGSTGNQTINGNLLVTGTTTLNGALSASTATFSGAISSVSPTFTGTPTAPTASSGTNTTQIATTAFVTTAVAGGLGTLGTMALQNANAVSITGGSLSGMTNVAGGTHSGTTATFSGAVTGGSGVFGAVSGTTGTFTGALSAASASFTTALPVLSGGTGVTTSTGSGSNVLSVSPTFTGTPLAPTATTGTNTTQIATTAFVQASTTALGLGTMSTQNSNNVSITGGAISGTTINSNVVGSNSVGARTVSTSAPAGGSNGDIWYQV